MIAILCGAALALGGYMLGHQHGYREAKREVITVGELIQRKAGPVPGGEVSDG